MTAPWKVRVLAGIDGDKPLSGDAHLAVHGALPAVARGRGADAALIREIEASGLLGRGGAGFPAGRKARTVGAGKRPAVVGNGAEGEPASGKDVLLMTRNPHLVLDGLAVTVRSVGGQQAHLVVHRGSPAVATMTAALRERRDVAVKIHEIPARYVSSEESAVVQWLNGGDAKPTLRPPGIFERGVDGRPTLVHNVETLAQLALIARHGADWFRSVGDVDEPGTMLLTITTPAGRRVAEVPTGTTVGAALEAEGHSFAAAGAVLIGGYFGTWMSRELAWHLPLTHYAMRAAGGGLGAGILIALPADGVCGLIEAARIATYLAGENAGQCGPCFNGLPALAAGLTALATRGKIEPAMSRWLSVIPRRGACAHPDGATRMIASALSTFAGEADRHAQHGPCAAVRARPMLPVPAPATDWR
ncbi:MAG: NADH-ubiquinone oxidoreductase-F iron-sulfur binding region domain-containing protein [Jatrophihabitans sp.]